MGWKDKVKAWWDGTDAPSTGEKSAAVTQRARSRAAAEAQADRDALWTGGRPAVLQAVWGKGLHGPGGFDLISTLIKPFGLNAEMSALDLGAGLGGATRYMARETGAWITGVEWDPLLQDAGMDLSKTAGMDKKAPVELIDPAHPTFRVAFDALFSKEALFTIHHKEDLLAEVARALKSRAQIQITDYVLGHSGRVGKKIEEWRFAEPLTAYPWTVGQYAEHMQKVGMEIRTTEDITEKHCAAVLAQWDNMTNDLPGRKSDRQTREALIEEAELWLRRMEAIETGDLRVYRFYAIGSRRD